MIKKASLANCCGIRRIKHAAVLCGKVINGRVAQQESVRLIIRRRGTSVTREANGILGSRDGMPSLTSVNSQSWTSVCLCIQKWADIRWLVYAVLGHKMSSKHMRSHTEPATNPKRQCRCVIAVNLKEKLVPKASDWKTKRDKDKEQAKKK